MNRINFEMILGINGPHFRVKMSNGIVAESTRLDGIITSYSTPEDKPALFSINLVTKYGNIELENRALQLAGIRKYDVLAYNCLDFIEELLDVRHIKIPTLLVVGGGLFSAYRIGAKLLK